MATNTFLAKPEQSLLIEFTAKTKRGGGRPRSVGFRFVVRRPGLGPCKEWQGYTDASGYGHTSRDGKDVRVHRWAYEESLGPIPEGMQVLHRCDNPRCCQVAHLFLGTNQDNVNDKVQKGRQSHLIGTQQPGAKLTDEDVLSIRNKRAEGYLLRELANEFGVSIATIHRVATFTYWRHV